MKKKAAIQLDVNVLVDWYEEDLLKSGERPSSVYVFAQNHGFEERAFYEFFGSFEGIEQKIFSRIMENTLDVLGQNADFVQYDAAQKLSGFYFTFFEVATANRSLVMHLLGHGSMASGLESMGKLKELRREFLDFAAGVLHAPCTIGGQSAADMQERVIREGAWVQFMTILRFWMCDSSPRFEKTDLLIEKSVRAGFDLVYQSPIESVVDLGKFMWKEMLGHAKMPR